MKIPLMIKQYLAVGIVGALVGAAGVAQLNPDGGLLGAADGSWLNELQGLDKKKAKAFRLGDKNNKGGKKVKPPVEAPQNYTAPDINIPPPESQTFAVNQEELDRVKLQIEDMVKNTILDKPNPEQCRQNLIEGDTLVTAIGEVRKATIVRTVPLVSACYVDILPKGCDEMKTFRIRDLGAEETARLCAGFITSAATGAKVIAIGTKEGALPLPGSAQVPGIIEFNIYAKGQFANDLDFSRRLPNQ